MRSLRHRQYLAHVSRILHALLCGIRRVVALYRASVIIVQHTLHQRMTHQCQSLIWCFSIACK